MVFVIRNSVRVKVSPRKLSLFQLSAFRAKAGDNAMEMSLAKGVFARAGVSIIHMYNFFGDMNFTQ